MCDGTHVYWLTEGFLLTIIEISSKRTSLENPVNSLRDHGRRMVFSKDLSFVLCAKKNILTLVDTKSKSTSTFDLASGSKNYPYFHD